MNDHSILMEFDRKVIAARKVMLILNYEGFINLDFLEFRGWNEVY